MAHLCPFPSPSIYRSHPPLSTSLASAPVQPAGGLPPGPLPGGQAAQPGAVPARLPAHPLQAAVLRPGPQPRGLPAPGRQGGAEGQGRPHRLHQGHLRLRQLSQVQGVCRRPGTTSVAGLLFLFSAQSITVAFQAKVEGAPSWLPPLQQPCSSLSAASRWAPPHCHSNSPVTPTHTSASPRLCFLLSLSLISLISSAFIVCYTHYFPTCRLLSLWPALWIQPAVDRRCSVEPLSVLADLCCSRSPPLNPFESPVR